jgi:hypothetical protein
LQVESIPVTVDGKQHIIQLDSGSSVKKIATEFCEQHSVTEAQCSVLVKHLTQRMLDLVPDN